MSKGAVLVTGASTGIGFAIANELAKNGYQVFAGIRKASDGERLLKQNPSIVPTIIDVTEPAAIEEAYRFIEMKRETGVPFSLVNNAGIAVPGPIEAISMRQFRSMFDVNVFGLVETTQKFLSIIRETKGRVINMSSVGGLIATPFMGGYNATKYAVEAISDSMRRELGAFGVKVIAVEPGVIKTPIWEKGLGNRDAIRAEMSQEGLAPYAEALDKFERNIEVVSKHGIEASEVGKCVRTLLEAENPPPRAIVLSKKERVQVALARYLPTKFIDKVMENQLFRV